MVEEIAGEKIVGYLPDDLKEYYRPLMGKTTFSGTALRISPQRFIYFSRDIMAKNFLLSIS
mgnify:CR=1 FL=1